MRTKLIAQVGKLTEWYTLALIAFGIPAIVWMYLSVREAITAFVLIQIILGVMNARGTDESA